MSVKRFCNWGRGNLQNYLHSSQHGCKAAGIEILLVTHKFFMSSHSINNGNDALFPATLQIQGVYSYLPYIYVSNGVILASRYYKSTTDLSPTSPIKRP